MVLHAEEGVQGGATHLTKVAIYLRTSTEDQGLSFETQEARCRAYCEFNGWEIVGVYKDESTGRDTKRREYRRMMGLCWKHGVRNCTHGCADPSDWGKWEIMVVYVQTRSHRNIRAFLDMLDDLKDNDRQFASVTEKIDTTSAYGWAFTAMLAVWGELESRVIGERVKGGVTTYKKNGNRWGPVPRWFEIVTIDGVRQVVPSAEGRAIIDFANGHSKQSAAVEYRCTRRAIQRLFSNVAEWRETRPWLRPEPRR